MNEDLSPQEDLIIGTSEQVWADAIVSSSTFDRRKHQSLTPSEIQELQQGPQDQLHLGPNREYVTIVGYLLHFIRG